MIRGVVRSDGALVEKEEALREAALTGHFEGWPLLVVAAALREYPHKGPSASSIASTSWRRWVLENLLDYYVPLESRYPLIRGTFVHSGFQAFKAPEGVTLIREKRMRIQVPKYEEIVLSGQVDLFYPDHNRLEDYKTCSHMPDYISDDHLVQLAVYAWLLRWHNFAVEKAAINYVGWHDCRHVFVAKMEDGSLGQAIGHRLMQDEQHFIEHIVEGWEVLYTGWKNHDVPPTMDCNLHYCQYCPVKWACDQIDVWGERINPGEFNQVDFV